MPSLTIVSNESHISVVRRTGNINYSCAEADWMEAEQEWWVSRVLVNPPEKRGKGIGSMLLKRLVKEARKYGGKIVVAPGGYDMNPEQQFNFYEKNGFKKVTYNDVTVLELE